MEKLVISLLVLMFLLPIAYAAETKIFSGTVITDQDKVVDGNTFKFIYDETSNKTFVQTPTQNMIVEGGKCNSNNVFKVCVNSASYYDRNITSYVTYYQLDVAIYKLTGSLSASSVSTNYNLLQGESANITITMINPTSLDISNIIYSGNLSGFQIINADGCTLNGDKISWSGSLQSGYNKVCTLGIIAQQKGAYNLAGTLSYFNGFETEKKSTDTLAINVLPGQLAVSEIVDADVEIEQPFYLNVALQNINPTEGMDLSVDINLPRNFILLNKVEGFSKDEGNLRKDSKLEAGSSLNYSLYLKADAESKIPITQVFKYRIKGLQYTIENDTFIKAPEPKPMVNLSSEYYELVAGQNFIVIAKIINPSKIYELNNIRARLTYGNDVIEQKLSKLMPNESASIISSTLVAPKNFDGLANNTVKLNLDIDYDFNEITKSTSKSIELGLKQSNVTSNATITKETTSLKTNSSDKTAVVSAKTENTSKQETTTKLNKEKLKLLFNKQILLIIGSVVVLFFMVLFIINMVKKGRKPEMALEEMALSEKALSEISEAIDKK